VSFNAANRSLKSRFTIGAAPPGEPFDDHVPDHLEPLFRRNVAPELPIERAVVGMTKKAGRTGEPLGATIHRGATSF
jgi:hypothetical protein